MTLSREIARFWEMSAAWDRAAEALARFDFAGFDREMRQFNFHREAGVANNAPVTDK